MELRDNGKEQRGDLWCQGDRPRHVWAHPAAVHQQSVNGASFIAGPGQAATATATVQYEYGLPWPFASPAQHSVSAEWCSRIDPQLPLAAAAG